MLLVYTGNGKGKSTAAAGLALRALGQKKLVCFIQLFKGKNFYGEQKLLTKQKGLDFKSFAHKHPFCFKNIKAGDVRSQCLKMLSQLRIVLAFEKYDLVIIDELNIAVRDKYLQFREVLEVILPYVKKTDILTTGRGASKQLIKIADLVTEMKEVKHPYNRGIRARPGIEF